MSGEKDIKNIHKIQEDIFGQFQILVGGDKSILIERKVIQKYYS
jgi:hypothetical protein